MIINYANLTRGLLCATNVGTTPIFDHYCRIQSTHCEQKLWPAVINGAGPDLLMNAAMQHICIVHDQSEKLRRTRALWQGLTFVRMTCEILWNVEPKLRRNYHDRRGGKAMEQYFLSVIADLDRSVKRYVDYYSQFYLGGPVAMEPCTCANVGDYLPRRSDATRT